MSFRWGWFGEYQSIVTVLLSVATRAPSYHCAKRMELPFSDDSKCSAKCCFKWLPKTGTICRRPRRLPTRRPSSSSSAALEVCPERLLLHLLHCGCSTVAAPLRRFTTPTTPQTLQPNPQPHTTTSARKLKPSCAVVHNDAKIALRSPHKGYIVAERGGQRATVAADGQSETNNPSIDAPASISSDCPRFL